MSFLARLLGKSAAKPTRWAPHGARAAFRSSRTGNDTQAPSGVRKELLRLVLRETLRNTGVPVEWIAIDPLGIRRPDRTAGVHVRLVVRHWDERFARYFCAFQQDFATRLQAFDPGSSLWLQGISWQFELGAGDDWPELPPRATWQGAAAPAPAPELLMSTVPLSREELSRQSAAEDLRHARRRPADFAPTETLPPREPGRR